jgi:PQQ-like domain
VTGSDVTRREFLETTLVTGGALLGGQLIHGGISSAVAQNAEAAATEWSSYGGDKANSKYSPLDQIGKDNFSRLKVAWTWRSPDEAITKENPKLQTWVWESTPLMVGGVLYVSTSMSQVAAIDATTGKTKWVYDPETWKNGTPSNNGFVQRGVDYWADGDDQRVLIGTGDGYLICLNAKTGKPIATFGQDGRIDLTQGLGRPVERPLYGVSSPPIICRDVVVMGSKVHEDPVRREMARRRARLRCPHGEAIVAVPLHPPRGRVRQRNMGAGFLENDGCRQRLDAHGRGRVARLRLPARSARPPTITTEFTDLATDSSETVWSPCMRALASASGIFRWPIMDCGTTTCPRPPT